MRLIFHSKSHWITKMQTGYWRRSDDASLFAEKAGYTQQRISAKKILFGIMKKI